MILKFPQIVFCHVYECKLIVLQCSTLVLSCPAYGCFNIVVWMFLQQRKVVIIFGGGTVPPTFGMEGHVPVHTRRHLIL